MDVRVVRAPHGALIARDRARAECAAARTSNLRSLSPSFQGVVDYGSFRQQRALTFAPR
jgi:hypothetical protein